MAEIDARLAAASKRITDALHRNGVQIPVTLDGAAVILHPTLENGVEYEITIRVRTDAVKAKEAQATFDERKKDPVWAAKALTLGTDENKEFAALNAIIARGNVRPAGGR